MSSNYKEIQVKYLKNSITDYKLKTKDDLKNIHGIDIDSIKGIENLSVNRIMFEDFLINFFNRWGLEARESIKPMSVFFQKNKNDGAYLKFVYKMGDNDCFLHVKGVNYFY